MKLFFSPSSPFVRKVMVVAHETGQVGAISLLPSGAHPIDRNQTIRAENPLAQVPTLVLDDGRALYDSPVICEYLDAGAGGRLFGTAPERWHRLTEQALGDGVLGAALLARYENAVRPEPYRWADWTSGQMAKVTDGLARFEAVLADAGERVDIGTITIGCTLGYLDFRFGDLGWRDAHPVSARWFERFSQRPSMVATAPAG